MAEADTIPFIMPYLVRGQTRCKRGTAFSWSCMTRLTDGVAAEGIFAAQEPWMGLKNGALRLARFLIYMPI
jgi:hypothetical protein